MTCIVFGSSMGNTEKAASVIAEKIKDETRLVNVTDMTMETFKDCSTVLLGSSTWGVGDLQDDWESKIDLLKTINLSGKKVGFFGCGDQEMYPDSFVSALGTLYEAVKGTVDNIIGKWPISGYSFTNSAAVVDDYFIGLALDEDNQPELTGSRIEEWVSTL
ncbi:MAG: flavodoxin [Spirochaetales bacterium]|nr:flavodoxin [Spirochaetales bacterium]